MTLADVNVMLHAFRADSKSHKEARDWLEGVVSGASAFGVSPQVLSGMVRISTHPKIYQKPSALDLALKYATTLLNHPRAVIVTPGNQHWSLFEDLCRKSKATGNLVQDAWLAALAIEWSCEWITYDRDYARFEGLRWRTLS